MQTNTRRFVPPPPHTFTVDARLQPRPARREPPPVQDFRPVRTLEMRLPLARAYSIGAGTGQLVVVKTTRGYDVLAAHVPPARVEDIVCTSQGVCTQETHLRYGDKETLILMEISVDVISGPRYRIIKTGDILTPPVNEAESCWMPYADIAGQFSYAYFKLADRVKTFLSVRRRSIIPCTTSTEAEKFFSVPVEEPAPVPAKPVVVKPLKPTVQLPNRPWPLIPERYLSAKTSAQQVRLRLKSPAVGNRIHQRVQNLDALYPFVLKNQPNTVPVTAKVWPTRLVTTPKLVIPARLAPVRVVPASPKKVVQLAATPVPTVAAVKTWLRRTFTPLARPAI